MTERSCAACRWANDLRGDLPWCSAPRGRRDSADRVNPGRRISASDQKVSACCVNREGGWFGALMARLTQGYCGPQGQWWEGLSPKD